MATSATSGVERLAGRRAANPYALLDLAHHHVRRSTGVDGTALVSEKGDPVVIRLFDAIESSGDKFRSCRLAASYCGCLGKGIAR